MSTTFDPIVILTAASHTANLVRALIDLWNWILGPARPTLLPAKPRKKRQRARPARSAGPSVLNQLRNLARQGLME